MYTFSYSYFFFDFILQKQSQLNLTFMKVYQFIFTINVIDFFSSIFSSTFVRKVSFIGVLFCFAKDDGFQEWLVMRRVSLRKIFIFVGVLLLFWVGLLLSFIFTNLLYSSYPNFIATLNLSLIL